MRGVRQAPGRLYIQIMHITCVGLVTGNTATLRKKVGKLSADTYLAIHGPYLTPWKPPTQRKIKRSTGIKAALSKPSAGWEHKSTSATSTAAKRCQERLEPEKYRAERHSPHLGSLALVGGPKC